MSTSALERAVVSWNRSHLDLAVVERVPLPFPAYWRAAMASLGERVDWSAPPPEDPGIA